jgi:2OG-Fe(II) oxygenase superfamily
MLLHLDRERLKASFANAHPFPFVVIENFLDKENIDHIASAYPTFDVAREQGHTFNAVNEKKKIQISKANLFPDPVSKLNDALASPQFLADLSYITGIPNLLADEELDGGGMHITGPGGRLDVHVDFNYIEERKLHRRLNLLLYLNPKWDESWGGDIQFWDKNVKHCEASFSPTLNRCVIFETNEISFHGVIPISSHAPYQRQSFATYYYTREAPAHWDGKSHSTIFKARPEEKFRGFVAMPAERVKRRMIRDVEKLKSGFKNLMGS